MPTEDIQAYLCSYGVLSTARPGTILCDISTIDPDTCREVATAARTGGVDCLDAPVSGGPVEAGNGKPVFLVGGGAAGPGRAPAPPLPPPPQRPHTTPPPPRPGG